MHAGSLGPSVIDLHPTPERKYPPVPWDRLFLEEADAARVLKYARSTFRAKAAAGAFPRYGEQGGYRYYIYDLIDYMMSRRQEA